MPELPTTAPPQTLPDWPTFGLTDDVRPALRRALEAAHPAALVTISGLDGGGPRPVGTQMVWADGVVSGFLSGGCVEGDVVTHAQACLRDGQPRRLVYGEGSPWPDIRLLCGARMELLVERVPPGDLAAETLFDLTENRAAAVWLTDGVRRECHPAERAPDPWQGALARRYEPAVRLVVMGSDPSALAIAALGAQAEFETTLVRPKGPAEPPPLAGVAYSRESPAQALAAVGIDGWTAIAAASHESELDHEALIAALPSAAFYVGALGARRRLPERLAALRAGGVSASDIDRLRAPIGLDLGGKAPWEVAVAVIGEIVALRYALSSGSTSTGSPTPAAAAPGRRLSSASAAANTVTSDES
jgi:xanthine dehydrogenase accessory factor